MTRSLARSPWLAPLLLVAIALDAGGARAQVATSDVEARALHQAATAAFEQGRFDEALARYRRAYELSPRPVLLYNIAAAADRGGHDAQALEAYEAYLAAIPQAENRAFVESRIAVLRSRVPRAPELVDDPVAPDVSGTDADPVADVSVEPTTTATVEAAPPPAGPDPTVPALLFGISGAAGIAAIVTGVLGWQARSELELACPMRACVDLGLAGRASEMEALGIATDVLAATSLVLAGAGLVAVLTMPSSEHGETALRLGPGGVALTGTF